MARAPWRAPAQAATDLGGTLVLKHDALVLLTDAFGDIGGEERGLGLFRGDTRAVSCYELLVGGARPVLLRTSTAGGYRGAIWMANAADTQTEMARLSVAITRERSLGEALIERIRLHNHATETRTCRVVLRVAADFADTAALRGLCAPATGQSLSRELEPDRVAFTYRGTDGRTRRTRVLLSEHPVATNVTEAGPVELVFDWQLAPGAERVLEVQVAAIVVEPGVGERHRRDPGGPRPLPNEEAEAAYRAWHASSTAITSGLPAVDRALHRALADLRMLVDTGPGPGERFIAAGLPWGHALIGRDAIITALQLLPVRPQVARDTLTVLARLQATERDATRGAQPGRILHELRTGELAASGPGPRGPSYGSPDATPLWLMLLGAYERWTGDRELVHRLWPAALAALGWIEDWADPDGDGLVEGGAGGDADAGGHGWRDAPDAIRFCDGRPARGPFALLEVQGYVHRARRELARLARSRGDADLGARQEAAADALRARIEGAFWLDVPGTYAMALDGDKRPVDAVASSAGHLLWCGVPSAERARRVASSLLGPELWSGWGIRTLSSRAAGYNPMGAHTGAVWPHDNAIAAAGLWQYGFRDEAARVASALLEATQHLRDARLPQRFCGFDRSDAPLPVPDPGANVPQAWAAGALFHLVGAMLGFQPDASAQELRLDTPTLPDRLSQLELQNLRVGDAVVDLRVRRADGSTGVEVLRRSGRLDVLVRV